MQPPAAPLVPVGDDGRVGFESHFTDPVKAREAQAVKTQTYKQKRADAQDRRREVGASVLGSVTDAAQDAMDSKMFANKTIEDLGDMIVKRNAKLTLLGGPLFTPTSVKEAAEVAHTWSTIAKNESIRKGKTKEDVVEDDSVQRAAQAMQRIARKLSAVKDAG